MLEQQRNTGTPTGTAAILQLLLLATGIRQANPHSAHRYAFYLSSDSIIWCTPWLDVMDEDCRSPTPLRSAVGHRAVLSNQAYIDFAILYEWGHYIAFY